MAPAAVHPCGGEDHGRPAAAHEAPTTHAHGDGHSETPAPDAPQEPRPDTCECVGCGALVAAVGVPAFRLELPAVAPRLPERLWPTAARAHDERAAHTHPFAIGPPLG